MCRKVGNTTTRPNAIYGTHFWLELVYLKVAYQLYLNDLIESQVMKLYSGNWYQGVSAGCCSLSTMFLVAKRPLPKFIKL